MSQEKPDSSEALQVQQTARRDLLKRAVLIGLGAGALLQPNGGVFGVAFGEEATKNTKSTKSANNSTLTKKAKKKKKMDISTKGGS